jgi:hypothetical protein
MFFGFLTYPHTSLVCSRLIMWPKSNHLAVFVFDLKSAYEGEHTIIGLLSLLACGPLWTPGLDRELPEMSA